MGRVEFKMDLCLLGFEVMAVYCVGCARLVEFQEYNLADALSNEHKFPLSGIHVPMIPPIHWALIMLTDSFAKMHHLTRNI